MRLELAAFTIMHKASHPQIVGAISLIILDIIYLTISIKYLYDFYISLLFIRYKFSLAIKMERS